MEKPTKGVKGKRLTPYDKGEPLHFRKEWRENHPDGTVIIDGVAQQEPKKKSWGKKKNIKNLGLPKTPRPPPMSAEEEEAFKERWRKSVDAYHAQDNSEMVTEPPLKQLENLVESIQPEVTLAPEVSLFSLLFLPVYKPFELRSSEIRQAA